MSRESVPGVGLALIGGGVAAVAALAWRQRGTTASTPVRAEVTDELDLTLRSSSWIHPVPSLGVQRPAVISSPFRAESGPGGHVHLGADLAYPRRDDRDLIGAFPVGTPGGTRLFFMPAEVPALAASAGVVVFAAPTGMGRTVIIRHADGWATYYTHLASLAVAVGTDVSAGHVLGVIGASPSDPQNFRHLHFELWRGANRRGATDPSPFLAAWPRVVIPWSPSAMGTESAFLASSVPTAVRNGTLTAYRPVGDRGEPYPTWVRALKGASGVYVIREIDGPIVYVGSSIGRLYDTLTRHFQLWRRYKGYWRGQFAEGADPGLTYDRRRVEVAIKLTSSDDAHAEELRTIRRLQPRDNQLGQIELEEAPF